VTQVSTLTADDILDLAYNVGEVQATQRFILKNQYLQEIGELNPVASSSITINANIDQAIKRTLQGLQLDPVDTSNINVISDRVEVRWVIAAPAGEVEYPAGTFLFSDSNRPRTSFGSWMKGTMYDQTVVINQGIYGSFAVNTGALVMSQISYLAAQVGFVEDMIEIDLSSVATIAPIAWKSGTSRYKIMSELCQLGGYYPPYFDNRGILRIRRAPATLDDAVVDHRYNAYQSRMIADTIVESDDLIDAPNRYVVLNTGATATEIVGVYDLPDAAPQSYFNRGFYVVKQIDHQGIESADQANLLARQAAYTDFENYSWVTFDGTPDPRHDLFDIVEYLGNIYYEVGWKLKLSPGGPHSHQLRRVYTDEPAVITPPVIYGSFLLDNATFGQIGHNRLS
jgi:hypothetical protein